MSRHIFLSHSHLDKPVADLVLNALEVRGIRCWVAPRDVSAGGSYAASIVDAIETAHSLILIYTNNCNTSPHVLREVERALYVGINIIPIRFDDSPPSKSLNYLLATVHWLSVDQASREIEVANAVDRITATLAPEDAALPLARKGPIAGESFPAKEALDSNRYLLAIAGIVFVAVAVTCWYALSKQPAAISPATMQRAEKSAPAPLATAVPAPNPPPMESATPSPVTGVASTPAPGEARTTPEVPALIPSPSPAQQNPDQAPLKGSWSQQNQKTNSNTIDVMTVKLVLDGNKFVFTKTTKSTFRRGVTQPREVPKGVQGYTHVTRYRGDVIFKNRDMIKIKLLTVDFPVRYPAWLSSGKRMEEFDAGYVSALAVWTLRRSGENLVDAEEPTTILRPEK